MNQKRQYVYDVREVSDLRELLESSYELYAPNVAFTGHAPGGGVYEITYETAYKQAVAFATYLNAQGLEGAKIAVTGRNCYEWALTYLAVTAGVGVIIPIDKDLRADEIEFMLADSGAKAIVYADGMEKTVDACKGDFLRLPMCDMEKYIAEGERLLSEGACSYQNHKVDRDALGILLYTSGTTGVSKGVMLSQHNICSNIVGIMRRVAVTPEDRVLSLLPLHHTYECTIGFLAVFYNGASIAYNASLRKIVPDLALFRPTILVAVPLVLESFRNNILKKYGKIKGGKAILASQKAIASVLRTNKAKRSLFSTIHETFGGRLHTVLSGAAGLAPEVFRDFERFGYRVLIGYGLTETSPVCLMHNDFYRSPDDIGYPVAGVRVKLVDANDEGVGEIAVKGPNVMLGYYNAPELTDAVMENGWFRTGDLAEITEKGAFRIKGRSKSMIVAPNGKKIFPEELELFLGKSPYVAESLVYGAEGEDGTVTITAVIYPDREAVSKALDLTPDDAAYAELEKALLKDEVAAVNRQFPQYKRIMKIRVRTEEFVKTTTKKIKRNDPENRK